jgi:hypothetical protein
MANKALEQLVVTLAHTMSARELADLVALLEPSFEGEPDEADLLRIGYVGPFKRFADGRVAAIMPMGAIDVLAVDINPWGHNDPYYYRSGGSAAQALLAWDGELEPSGWFRHPPSGRRRVDGDPATEYFQP